MIGVTDSILTLGAKYWAYRLSNPVCVNRLSTVVTPVVFLLRNRREMKKQLVWSAVTVQMCVNICSVFAALHWPDAFFRSFRLSLSVRSVRILTIDRRLTNASMCSLLTPCITNRTCLLEYLRLFQILRLFLIFFRYSEVYALLCGSVMSIRLFDSFI